MNTIRRRSVLLVSFLVAACASVDGDSVLRDTPPCPILLAIDDFPEPPQPRAVAAHELPMTASASALTSMLVHSLTTARAASRIVPLSSLADVADADVVLTPHLREAVTFAHEGPARTWLASTGLWLVTWIGGMAVVDSTYRSSMAVDCALRFHSDNTMAHRSVSAAIDATFLQRNRFFSWSTLQSLVLPPFLTSDDTIATRDALTRGSVASVADDLTALLKGTFEDEAWKADHCSIHVAEPANAAVVSASSVTIKGTVDALDKVLSVSCSLRGQPPQTATLTPPTAADPEHPGRVLFECTIDGLQIGDNFVRLRVVAGDPHTRTLVFRRT